MKNKNEIVVARFKEDIIWLLPYKNITTIYNKGDDNILLNNFNTIKLPNIGRESHTYLYHIINNYDNLADKTIFFQGKIDDHKVLNIEEYFNENKDFIGKLNVINIEKLKKNIEHIGKWEKDYITGDMKKCNFTPFEWLDKVIGIKIDEKINITNIVWGANFSVSKNMILLKPKKFYENILRYIDYHKNPEEGHYLERTWYLILNSNFKKKNMIGYLFVKNNLDKIINILNKNNHYHEIHLWYSLEVNNEIGNKYKINYTPNNKYLLIKPKIENNSFFLNIKGKNDARILVEFTNIDDIYEIILGCWNNTKSIIRYYNKNKILYSYEKKTLCNHNFIRFDFIFSEQNVIIKLNNDIIINILNIFKFNKIKSVKINSYFNSNIFWDYDNDSELNYNNIKLHLCNNIYDNIKLFYTNNYYDYYIENIDLINYI